MADLLEHWLCAVSLRQQIGETMSEKSKKNAKELRKAWKEFLKRQEQKNVKQRKQTQMQ